MSGIKNILSPPKPRDPPAPPPIPQREDPAVEQARHAELVAARAAKGRQATLLTGGSGVTAEASTRKKTLLGGTA